MKSIRIRLLLAALAVLLGTVIGRSQTADDNAPPMHGPRDGMGEHRGFFPRELNLTDAQKTQMKSIMQKEHPAMKPLFEQSRQIEQQLHQYSEGTYDEAKVRALATQKAQVETELTVHQTRVHNEMYQILTADQQSKLKQLEAEHQERMQQRMHDNPPDAEE